MDGTHLKLDVSTLSGSVSVTEIQRTFPTIGTNVQLMFPTQKIQVLPENEKFILFHESRQDRSVQKRSVHARGKSQASGHEMYSLDITPTLSRTLSSKYHELSHELYHLNLTDCILSFTNRVNREEHPCPRPKPWKVIKYIIPITPTRSRSVFHEL